MRWKVLAGSSKLHTTFLENFLRKTNSLEKNICSYIRNLGKETLDSWQTFSAQLQNCFQLIHGRFSKNFFWKIHSLLFVFDHSARRSDLWRKLLVMLSEEHSLIPEKNFQRKSSFNKFYTNFCTGAKNTSKFRDSFSVRVVKMHCTCPGLHFREEVLFGKNFTTNFKLRAEKFGREYKTAYYGWRESAETNEWSWKDSFVAFFGLSA